MRPILAETQTVETSGAVAGVPIRDEAEDVLRRRRGGSRSREGAAEEAARAAAEAGAARDAEEAQARAVEGRHARLSELADEDAGSAADDVDLGSARKRFGLVRREWTEVSTGLTVDEAVAARFAEAERKLIARETNGARRTPARGARRSPDCSICSAASSRSSPGRIFVEARRARASRRSDGAGECAAAADQAGRRRGQPEAEGRAGGA